MRMPPSGGVEGAVLHERLVRIVRRTWAANVLSGASILLLLVSIGRAAGFTGAGIATGLVAFLILLWHGRRARTMQHAARRVEQAATGSHNVVITAEELTRNPERAAPWVRARVLHDADRVSSATRIEAIVPLGRGLGGFAASLALLVAAWSGLGGTGSRALRTAVAGLTNTGKVAASSPLQVLATVTPPDYTGQAAREIRDPERIEAIEGSSLKIAVSGGTSLSRIRSAAGPLTPSTAAGGTVVETRMAESGYIAIEPADGRGDARNHRLIPLVAIPDRAPVVRIEAPGRDLVLPDARRVLDIEATASDDLGLAALEVRYIRVSGSGEQFEFEEGTIPVTLTRDSNLAWKARGRIALSSLKLEPGDSLVYRAVARDRRPGDAGLATSDTFFVEIAAPDAVPLEGFEMPPDQERYALSQQMIVLKIQRLRARERGMAPAALAEAGKAIAAEQRAVRANFIFLMGGQVEDENVEAEQSSQNDEGRLQNTAHQEISTAIAHMTRAEAALVAPDTAAALAAARAAVDALQRAFGRHRYILRTIPVRGRVDPARRLTGELSAAVDWQRELDTPTADRETQSAQNLLTQLLEAASALRAGRQVDASAFAALAERALAINSADATWQDVARRLQETATVAGTDASAVSARLAAAITPVLARARRDARPAADPSTAAPSRLYGAWALESSR
jgi:hypothetical protein